MNICFTSNKKELKREVLDSVFGFHEIFSPPPENIDILVVTGDGDLSEFKNSRIDTCIFAGNNVDKILQLKNLKSAISCGMEQLDSVTFSSISEDSALLCIRRRLIFSDKSFDPCEVKTSFNPKMGIYQNIVVSLLNYITRGERNESI